MKIVVKTLKQVIYNLEITSEKSTILDLKKEIEKSYGFNSSTLKLLLNGVILNHSKTLEYYKIKEEITVIMMNSKIKPKNMNQSSNISSFQQKSEGKEEKRHDKPKEKKQQEPNKDKYIQKLNSLVDMGFEKSQAKVEF